MMYNKYHKQREIIVIPKSNDKNNIKGFNKFDIKIKIIVMKILEK